MVRLECCRETETAIFHARTNRPLARNNFLPVLESWVTQLFQLGVRWRRAAATMGDNVGRFTSDVTARLPSAALWSACSLTVTFSTCGGSTGALLALKNPFISCVVRRNLQFY